MDFDAFRKNGYQMVDAIIEYYRNLDNVPGKANAYSQGINVDVSQRQCYRALSRVTWPRCFRARHQ